MDRLKLGVMVRGEWNEQVDDHAKWQIVACQEYSTSSNKVCLLAHHFFDHE